MGVRGVLLFLCQEVTRGGFSTRVSLFSPSLPVDVTLPAGIERSTKGQRNMQDEPELEKKTCVGKGRLAPGGVTKAVKEAGAMTS